MMRISKWKNFIKLVSSLMIRWLAMRKKLIFSEKNEKNEIDKLKI